jgi:L-rhamnose mutarotase
VMELKPGMAEEYERRHEDVWAELLDVLSASGVRNYSLFRRGSTVIAYCECHPTAAEAFGRVGESEINERWSLWFDDVIETLTDENGDLLWAPEVWHRDLDPRSSEPPTNKAPSVS